MIHVAKFYNLIEKKRVSFRCDYWIDTFSLALSVYHLNVSNINLYCSLILNGIMFCFTFGSNH